MPIYRINVDWLKRLEIAVKAPTKEAARQEAEELLEDGCFPADDFYNHTTDVWIAEEITEEEVKEYGDNYYEALP